jgi:hypothetical protein
MNIQFPEGMSVELRYKEDSDTPVQNSFIKRKKPMNWEEEFGIERC